MFHNNPNMTSIQVYFTMLVVMQLLVDPYMSWTPHIRLKKMNHWYTTMCMFICTAPLVARPLPLTNGMILFIYYPQNDQTVKAENKQKASRNSHQHRFGREK